MLDALSPLDGRYADDVSELRRFFSEEALIRSRLFIEVSYLVALAGQAKLPELKPLSPKEQKALWDLVNGFSGKDAAEVKRHEKETRHDVKALEYFLRARLKKMPGMEARLPFVHFGLTSEDVNNLAYGLLIQEALRLSLLPALGALQADLERMGKLWRKIPMLSLTHGQPATPTTVGKELLVFSDRLERQLTALSIFRMQGKFGGAVGTFAAHRAAYPAVKWESFGRGFVDSLGMVPLEHTTQINPHDDLAELSHLLIRVSTILLDCSQDCWLYVSRGIFRQAVKPGEVGSSTMPHKVNPIDFEMAEGNLGIARALCGFFAEKLPVSRLQRDLSDSTVQRNLGVAFGHLLLAAKSLRTGLAKLSIDTDAAMRELEAHPEVAAEAIQTVLRKHGVADAYERLKALTRGRHVTRADLHAFIDDLPIPEADKRQLKKA